MPSGENWIAFLYVNAAFLACITVVYVMLQISLIKDNWAAYRCNPMFMPLADNVQDNFSYCVQNMQGSQLQYLLQPFSYLTGQLVTNADQSVTDTNNVRAMFNKTRTLEESNNAALRNTIKDLQAQLAATESRVNTLATRVGG